jgi:hypothetical protein
VSNADSIVRRCEGCQFFACLKYVPSHQLQTIPITWPFSTWGLDLVGSFKKAKGGFTHIFMAVDKFTKLIEVKLVASITAAKAVEFNKKSCTNLVFPKILSLIMGLNSLCGSLKTFVQTRASKSTMPQCHTHRATTKSSAQTP